VREHETRVVIVEDQPLYRSMLRTLLESHGLRVVAEAGGAAAARAAIEPGSADVALLDIHLADGNGIGLGVSLRRADPELGIVLLSSQDSVELMLDLPLDVRRGWCYLSKSSATSEESLLRAIAAAQRGETMIDPHVLRGLTRRRHSSLESLTDRQFEVLRLVAQGLSNQGIAERLRLSVKSIENHLGSVYAALDIPAEQNQRVAAVLRLIDETVREP